MSRCQSLVFSCVLEPKQCIEANKTKLFVKAVYTLEDTFE